MEEKRTLRLVLTGILFGILMSAMDYTTVVIALGSISGDLGGVDSYVWITSAYAVAVLAGMPIFGLEFGGKQFDWSSWQIISLFSIYVIFFIVFMWAEMRAKELINSFWMFKNHLFASFPVLTFVTGQHSSVWQYPKRIPA